MATYYINADTGDNTTGDGSQGSPWLTLSYAYSQVNSGDTIIAQDSTSEYTMPDNFSPTKEFTLSGETVGGAVFSRPGVSSVSYWWRTYSNITLNRIDFRDIIPDVYDGILNVYSTADLTINNCRFYDITYTQAQHCIFSTNNTGKIKVNNCAFFDIIFPATRGWFICQNGGDNTNRFAEFVNNVFYFKNQPGNETQYFTGKSDGTAGTISLTMYNNILYNGQSVGIAVTNYTSGSNNCFYGPVSSNFTNLPNTITSDPMLIDPSNRNFNLSPSSPCIDAGTLI